MGVGDPPSGIAPVLMPMYVAALVVTANKKHSIIVRINAEKELTRGHFAGVESVLPFLAGGQRNFIDVS